MEKFECIFCQICFSKKMCTPPPPQFYLVESEIQSTFSPPVAAPLPFRECLVGCPPSRGTQDLPHCPKFVLLTAQHREQVVRDAHVCYRCLKSGHVAVHCPDWERRCGAWQADGPPCKRVHHFFLHGINSSRVQGRH